MGNAGLQGIKAIIQRQQRVLAEGDDDRFLRDAQHRRMGILGAGPHIACATPAPPFGNRFGVDPVTLGQRPQALLTILYCSTVCIALRIAAVVLALP